ncbi:MAG: hypothetical protein OZ948_09430 [Deltaproteobacteria bacterium]|nr:hypothetical protein [Deltaproteobacteria bacterium]
MRGPALLLPTVLLLGLAAGSARAQIPIDPVPVDPIPLEVYDVAVDLRAPRILPRRHRFRTFLRVRIRNPGPLPVHVTGVELLARSAGGADLGPAEPIRVRPIELAPGRSTLAFFRWKAPSGGLAEGEPVLFFACAATVETDGNPENDCDLELATPREHPAQLVIDDAFEDEGSYWEWYQNGTGTHALAGGSAAFTVTGASHAGAYSDAEINDYRRGPERGFPWGPGLRLELRARASDSNGLDSDGGRGTRGFGFWNLGRGGPGAPDAMTNAWFLSISPESLGFGILAATVFDRGQPVFLQALPTDLRRWHRYGIVWTPSGVTFTVDDRPLAATSAAPADPLGFVAWIDNYRLEVTPDGIGTSFLDLDQDQTLFVDHLRIWSFGEPLADPGTGRR